jgi:hypothetical protein
VVFEEVSWKNTKNGNSMHRRNNISGKSFALFNSVDPKYLQELATDLEISIGQNEEEVAQ